jgi:hypothetical protein
MVRTPDGWSEGEGGEGGEEKERIKIQNDEQK